MQGKIFPLISPQRTRYERWLPGVWGGCVRIQAEDGRKPSDSIEVMRVGSTEGGSVSQPPQHQTNQREGRSRGVPLDPFIGRPYSYPGNSGHQQDYRNLFFSLCPSRQLITTYPKVIYQLLKVDPHPQQGTRRVRVKGKKKQKLEAIWLIRKTPIILLPVYTYC